MNNFKFRAWNKKEKTMHYFTMQDLIEGKTPIKKIKNWEIMRGAELQDKEGVEVYEGDYVNYYDYNDILSEGVSPLLVVWKEGNVYPRQVHGIGVAHGKFEITWYGVKFKVIGNIYQNPEILNK